MTFSEYFNALYPYLSNEENPAEFFEEIIGHFIYEEAQEACKLLNCKPDTKRRYVKEEKPNKIKPAYAKYVYSKHNSSRYINWLNEKMYQADAYDRIEEWLTNNGIEFNDVNAACDTLLADIFFYIAHPNAIDGSEVRLPEVTIDETSQQYGTNDANLLKEFHIDFDSILNKCIANDPTDVWFTKGLSTKINGLYYEKWKNQIPRFEDLGLQSNILGTIATLQELCNAIDPNKESATVISVRRLRIKLRDNYVKIHPDIYGGLFPYEAFIDDWNDEGEYDT